MSDGPLTREEIRRACLAVGMEREVDYSMGESMEWFRCSLYPGDAIFPEYEHGELELKGHALALLEAWRGGRSDLGYSIHRGPDGEGNDVFVVALTRWIPGVLIPQTLSRCYSTTLPTAAVRAVLQATQTPGEEDPHE